MPVVKDFLIIFRKKSHSADFLPEQTLDFILHRLLAGLAEMDTDKIGSLAVVRLNVGQGSVFAVFVVSVIENPPVKKSL